MVNSLFIYLKNTENSYLRFTPNQQLLLEAITKLVAFIEHPNTSGNEREKAISELNLTGTPSAEIEEIAYSHWQNYFAENIEEILTKRLVIISHLLPDKVVNQCFEDVFQEFQDRKKQMGIDDIRKFWAP